MINLSMRFVFDRKGITKNDPKKKALVQIEIFDRTSRKKIYISTDIKLFVDQYSSDGGLTIKKHPNAALLRNKAHSMYNEIERYIISGKCHNLDDVKNWNKKAEFSGDSSLIDFLNDENGKENMKDSNQKNFNSFMTRLVGFGTIKQFKDLTYSNISDFNVYLRKYIHSQPTLYKRHTTSPLHNDSYKKRIME